METTNAQETKKDNSLFIWIGVTTTLAIIASLTILIVVLALAPKQQSLPTQQAQQQKNSQNTQQPQETTQQPPQQQQQEGNSPINDNIYITTSIDPAVWTTGKLVAEKASVPDVLQLNQNLGTYKKGDVLIYFVDFSTMKTGGSEGLAIIASRDNGKTWSERTSVSVKGTVNKGAAVDPSVVQLDDGSLRLYFFGSETTQGDPARTEGKHKVYSATSSDGINFTVEKGERFAAEKLTDPEVVRFKNKWFMYYSTGTETKLALSSDGLNFTQEEIVGGTLGGVPGALPLTNGLRLFGCGMGGIAMGNSADGIRFTQEKNDIFNGALNGIVCDPAVIQLNSKEYAMVYKVRNIGNK